MKVIDEFHVQMKINLGKNSICLQPKVKTADRHVSFHNPVSFYANGNSGSIKHEADFLRVAIPRTFNSIYWFSNESVILKNVNEYSYYSLTKVFFIFR